MELCDFVNLHHKIQKTSTKKISKIISSLDEKSKRHLLSIFCRFFFDENKRKEYVNQNDESSMKIVQVIQKKNTKSRKKSTSLNKFDSLPQFLLSHTISFLNHSSRVKTALINHSFYRAANQSIAKKHFLINSLFMEKKLCEEEFDDKPFKNISSITFEGDGYIKGLGKKRYERKEVNILKLIKCINLERAVLGWYYIETLRDLPASKLVSLQLDAIRNDNHSFDPTVELAAFENLEHLQITNCRSSGELKGYNSIFHLYMFPRLKSFTFRGALGCGPDYTAIFDALLDSSKINRKLKKQKDFKKLSLCIDFAYTYTESQDMVKKHTKLNDFLVSLKAFYSNLTCIECNIAPYSDMYRHPLFVSRSFDWKGIFANVTEIKMRVFSTEVASNLLKYVKMRNNVKVFHVTGISRIHPTPKDLDSFFDNPEVNSSYVNEFMDAVCDFLSNRSKILISFGVSFYDISGKYANLKDDYFGSYEKYLGFLLQQIKENGDVFDGYLKLELPEAEKFRFKEKSRYNNEWTKEHIACSLKIARLICEIQTEIMKYNKNNPRNEKKMILDLDTLQLLPKHETFLKFWFNENQMLYDNEIKHFVLY